MTNAQLAQDKEQNAVFPVSRIVGAGGCPVVVDQWQSTSGSSQVSSLQFPVTASFSPQHLNLFMLVLYFAGVHMELKYDVAVQVLDIYTLLKLSSFFPNT